MSFFLRRDGQNTVGELVPHVGRNDHGGPRFGIIGKGDEPHLAPLREPASHASVLIPRPVRFRRHGSTPSLIVGINAAQVIQANRLGELLPLRGIRAVDQH